MTGTPGRATVTSTVGLAWRHAHLRCGRSTDAPVTAARRLHAVKKVPLYSRSPQATAAAGSTASAGAPAPAPAEGRPAAMANPAVSGTPPGVSAGPSGSGPAARRNTPAHDGLEATAPSSRGARGRGITGAIRRHERWGWAAAMLAVLLLVWFTRAPVGGPPALSARQIDALVRQSLEEKPLPAQAARAYDAIRGSVVRVVGLMTEGDEGDDAEPSPGSAGGAPRAGGGGDKGSDKGSDKAGGRSVERGVGTGVVIVNNGTILTNLHVVQGARRIKVTFADGSVSDARVVNVQPENDLAVLRARSIPDDLEAATMRSTADLQPGEEVMAVGFPFGIGPSVSVGVVSGLKREFVSPDGQQKLTNLIQFDAAANPGNSGGPLVTNDGAVVGIVTAILNPSRQRTFIGIGFAVPIENAATGAGMPPF